jgi:hypothetical protein
MKDSVHACLRFRGRRGQPLSINPIHQRSAWRGSIVEAYFAA